MQNVRTSVLPAVVAGVASVLLFLPILGGHPAGSLLAYLSALPLMTAGLGWGRVALFGAIGIAGVAALGIGVSVVVAFGALAVIPALVVGWQGLLVRRHPDGSTEWFPLGSVLCTLVMAGTALMLVFLGMLDIPEGATAQSYIAALMEPVVTTMALPTDLREAMLTVWSWWVPSVAVAGWTVAAVVNGALAQAIVARQGWALRPRPQWSDIRLSDGPVVVVAVALAVLLWFGPEALPGYGALNACLAMGVAFFLSGLAFCHRWAARQPKAVLWLVGLYGLVVVVVGWMALVLTGVGLVRFFALKIRRQVDADGQEE